MSITLGDMRLGAPRSPALRFGALLAENLVPNPSLEVDTTGWTGIFSGGFTGTAMTRATDWSASGSASLRIQATQPADSTARFAGPRTPTGASGMPVTPGTPMTVRGIVNHVDAPASGSRIDLTWYKADGSASATPSTGGTLTGGGTPGVHTVTTTATVPADAAFMAINPTSRTAASGDVVDVKWDALMAVQTATLPPYFDGDSPRARWTSAAYASASRLYSGSMRLG